jgi:hypothetical protein
MLWRATRIFYRRKARNFCPFGQRFLPVESLLSRRLEVGAIISTSVLWQAARRKATLKRLLGIVISEVSLLDNASTGVCEADCPAAGTVADWRTRWPW